MTVSVIGCGNMGASIALALDRKGYSLCLYDIDGNKAAGLGLPVAKDLDEALERADIVLLAVKPQVIPSLYDTLSEHNDKSYISILAGVPLEVLEYKLDADNIARFMPNIAARALKAVTAIAFSQAADEDFRKRAYDIAESFGSAFILDEALFPAFIGLSGSGIAYAFQFIHAMAMGAVEQGIPYPRAVEIASDTLESAFSLIKETGKGPVELATMVCSAGGTTIKGMNALSCEGFDKAVVKAVAAATERSVQLERTALEKKDND